MPSSDDARDLKELLRGAGLRATAARAAVLRCLIDAAAPMTHGDVCESLSSLAYDRATLYRNLMDLTEVGLATRTDLGDHLWRFELAGRRHHDESAHPHFVCRECGDVSCLPEDAIAVKAVRDAPHSLRNNDVEIHIRGVCNDCR